MLYILDSASSVHCIGSDAKVHVINSDLVDCNAIEVCVNSEGVYLSILSQEVVTV